MEHFLELILRVGDVSKHIRVFDVGVIVTKIVIQIVLHGLNVLLIIKRFMRIIHTLLDSKGKKIAQSSLLAEFLNGRGNSLFCFDPLYHSVQIVEGLNLHFKRSRSAYHFVTKTLDCAIDIKEQIDSEFIFSVGEVTTGKRSTKDDSLKNCSSETSPFAPLIDILNCLVNESLYLVLYSEQ